MMKSNEHLTPERIADIAVSSVLSNILVATDSETRHLTECRQCNMALKDELALETLLHNQGLEHVSADFTQRVMASITVRPKPSVADRLLTIRVAGFASVVSLIALILTLVLWTPTPGASQSGDGILTSITAATSSLTDRLDSSLWLSACVVMIVLMACDAFIRYRRFQHRVQ